MGVTVTVLSARRIHSLSAVSSVGVLSQKKWKGGSSTKRLPSVHGRHSEFRGQSVNDHLQGNRCDLRGVWFHAHNLGRGRVKFHALNKYDLECNPEGCVR